MAVWPTLTLLMSDSLNATVIVSELVSTISANGLLELDEPLEPLELPRLPAADVALSRAGPGAGRSWSSSSSPSSRRAAPAETGSPGDTSATEAMVPAAGA